MLGEAMPQWVFAAHVGVQAMVAFAAALVTSAAAHAVMLRSVARVSEDAHWTESARTLFPARRTSTFVTAFVLIVAAGVAPGVSESRIVPTWVLAAACVAAAVVGARLGGAPLRRRLAPRSLSLRARVSGFFGGLLALYPLVLVAVLFGANAPSELSWRFAAWALLFAAATWAVIGGLGMRLAERVGLLRPAPPELATRIDAMARRLELAPVRSYVLRMNQLNAFAMPQIRLVAVTDSLLAQVSPAEIAAICAHELGHIGEGPQVVRTRKLIMWFVYGLVAGAHLLAVLDVPVWGRLFALFALLALKLRFAGGFSRAAEERADQVARSLEESPGLFARALEKLYRLNALPAVMPGKGSSHPHLYDRMVAVGVEPGFARPEPPDAKAGSGAMSVAVLLALVLMTASQVGMRLAGDVPGAASRERLVAAAVVAGPTPHLLSALARRAYLAEDYASAAELYLAAAQGVSSAQAQLNAALALARAHRCGDADERLRLADAVLAKRSGKKAETDDDYYVSVRSAVSACDVEDVTAH